MKRAMVLVGAGFAVLAGLELLGLVHASGLSVVQELVIALVLIALGLVL